MKILIAVFVLCIATSATVVAKDFTIEDGRLAPLPKKVVLALKPRAEDPEGNVCKYIGETIDLDGDGKAADYFVTTDNACQCGAALCPIWIIRGTGDAYSTVISDGGYGASVGKKNTKGLANITIWAVTAGYEEKAHYVFDGRAYNQGERKIKFLGGR